MLISRTRYARPKPLEEDLGALRHPLERGRRVLRLLEQDHLDLVELVDAQDAAGVLASRAGFAPEARGVGGIADRQLGRLEDLVAMQVRDRDLGRRDQVQLVAGDDVHLVFLVRDLAGAGRARRVDDGRRPDLGEAVLAGVDVEEPADESALEGRAGALVDREPGAGDLGAAGVVDDVERLTELPVRLARPGGTAGRRVGADLAVERLVVGEHLAPGPDRDVRLLATDRDVRDRPGSGCAGAGRRAPASISARLASRPVIRSPAATDAALSSATSGPSGFAPPLIASPIRLEAALRSAFSALALAQQPAPLRVQFEGPVDDGGILALVDRALADDVRLVAKALQADAHS